MTSRSRLLLLSRIVEHRGIVRGMREVKLGVTCSDDEVCMLEDIRGDVR